MPLPGGPSAKAGDRYELLWTVNCMLRLMAGEAESIRLEPPGQEGEGIEFTIDGPSGTEYHQVKRQRTGQGAWTLAGLAKEGVLTHFHQKLDAPSAEVVFVSAHAAHPLDEMAARARAAGSWEAFERAFVSSNKWSVHFDTLHRRWGSPEKSDSYERLRRVYVRTIDEESLRGLSPQPAGRPGGWRPRHRQGRSGPVCARPNPPAIAGRGYLGSSPRQKLPPAKLVKGYYCHSDDCGIEEDLHGWNTAAGHSGRGCTTGRNGAGIGAFRRR